MSNHQPTDLLAPRREVRLALVVGENSDALTHHARSLDGEQWHYPERELHPLHQMSFARSVLARDAGRIVMPTHSEAVISGVGLDVRYGKIRSEDVEIHVVDMDEVRVARYDVDGSLVNWSFGFFAPTEDSARETPDEPTELTDRS